MNHSSHHTSETGNLEPMTILGGLLDVSVNVPPTSLPMTMGTCFPVSPETAALLHGETIVPVFGKTRCHAVVWTWFGIHGTTKNHVM